MAVLEAAPAPPERRSTRRVTGATAVTLLAVVWGLKLGLEPLHDNSFLTHLAGGRLALEGGIPRTDPFSFTAPGAPWVVQSWLAAGLYAVTDRIAGGYGALALNAVLMVSLALLVCRLTRGLTSLLPRLALVGVALGVGAGAWAERPLLFGLLGIGLTLLVVEEGRLDPRWLVPAYALWVNLHGSFPLGAVLLVTLAVGSRLDGRPVATELEALRWAVVGILVGALGPLGPRLLLFPVELLGRNDVLSDVVEWMAPTFTSGWERLWLLQLLGAAVLLVRRPRWRVAVPLFVFGAASLLAVRNVPVASLVLLPGMVAACEGMGSIDARRASRSALFASGALVAVGAALVVTAASRPAYDLSSYPAAQFALLGDGTSRRIASQDFVGNWLTATLGPDAAVFYDDRFDMYPADLSADYGVLNDGGPGWEDVLDRRGVDAVVWRRDLPLAQLLAQSPDWHVVGGARAWLTAVRR